MSDEGVGPLDLSGADLSGFEALDSGRYNAEVVEVNWDAVKNPGGKTPIGTPILKVKVRVLEPRINDEVIDQERFAWAQYVKPPNDYDPKKKATMNGFIVRFFVGLGFTEEEIMSGNFDPDFDDLKGTATVVTLGKEAKKDGTGEVIEGEFNNPIKGFKPAGSIAATSSSGLL